jgi:hypothetical protein
MFVVTSPDQQRFRKSPATLAADHGDAQGDGFGDHLVTAEQRRKGRFVLGAMSTNPRWSVARHGLRLPCLRGRGRFCRHRFRKTGRHLAGTLPQKARCQVGPVAQPACARSRRSLAVVGAKDNNQTVSAGIQQALDYAQTLDIPFVFSSNGRPTTSNSTTGAATNTSPPAAVSKPNPWYPDHAVFSATKDELKAMPEFKYST